MKLLISILTLLLSFNAYTADWYVATNGTGGGASWADATHDLQDAITSCASNFTVWVSNGIYVTNLTVGGGVTVRSKDTDPLTVIFDGGGVDRVITNEASSWIAGITISNGYIVSYPREGAGIQNGNIVRCIVKNNVADGSNGGGLDNGYAYSCLFITNIATGADGNAAYGSFLYNCTIVRNEGYNTGLRACVVWNCISYYSPGDQNITDYYSDGILAYGAGIYTGPGSIYLDPRFVSGDDFNLQDNSPCVNRGTNFTWMTDSGDVRSKDLLGNDRIHSNSVKVDMGAYESPYLDPKLIIYLFTTSLNTVAGSSSNILNGRVDFMPAE
ncbi:choice-of-anchor Q domain-containing protein [Verrucomicrobiota bacterium]